MNAQLATLEQVPFHGDTIEAAIGPDGKRYASVRRTCDSIGLNFASQYTKLRNAPWATVAMIATVAEDGKARELMMIELDSLPMWLAGINTRKVSAAVRARVELYQCEAKQVLADWFLRRQAPAGAQPSTASGVSDGTIQALVEAVSAHPEVARELHARIARTSATAREGPMSFRLGIWSPRGTQATSRPG